MKPFPAFLACCLLVASVEAQYSIGSAKKKRGGGGVSNPVQPTEKDPPSTTLTSPVTGPLAGLSVTVTATASDAGSGVASVSFYWQYCPTQPCGAYNLIGTDATDPYSAVWTFPACGPYPDDKFSIQARATDGVGNVGAYSGVDVRLTGRGC